MKFDKDQILATKQLWFRLKPWKPQPKHVSNLYVLANIKYAAEFWVGKYFDTCPDCPESKLFNRADLLCSEWVSSNFLFGEAGKYTSIFVFWINYKLGNVNKIETHFIEAQYFNAAFDILCESCDYITNNDGVRDLKCEYSIIVFTPN